ncbi:helix-turn-helix domain-containing protein [Levilactobacillus acidifarinae]|nr:helix-turn-helix transcriptional regulator [Levilactobacillus acidifarinae]
MTMHFSRQLTQLRQKRHLSQDQLATQLGVSAQAVTDWEQGQATPDLTMLVRLAAQLNVSLDQLVLGSQSDPMDMTQHQPRPGEHLNGWDFLARYWWVLIAIVAIIGSFFGK